MDISTVLFDPTDMRPGINPPFFSDDPLRIDTRQFVGRTIYLDPRRVKPQGNPPQEECRDIAELAQEIMTDGQSADIVVYPILHPDYDVELQTGERWTRSCVLAKCMIRAEIRPVPQDRLEHFDDAFIKTFKRRNRSLLEIVESVEMLLAHGRSWQNIARMAGKTKAWVEEYIALAKMNPAVRPFMKPQDMGWFNGSGRKWRRKSALPLHVWFEVAKKPYEQQPFFVSLLIESGRSIEEAMQYPALPGQPMRQRSVSELFMVLEHETQRMKGFCGRYLEMLKGGSHTAFDATWRQKLDDDIKEMALYLSGFSGTIGLLKMKLRNISCHSHHEASKQLVLSSLHPELQKWVIRELGFLKESNMSIEQLMESYSLPHILNSGE